MFLSEDVLSSNISNMNLINIFFFLCLFACACDNASRNGFYVSASLQSPRTEIATERYGSKTVRGCVVRAGTALKKYFKYKRHLS